MVLPATRPRADSGPFRRSEQHLRCADRKAIYGGAFLARFEGKAVFVPLVLPGEHARVRVVDDKRGYATAEVEEIVAASSQRVAPACPLWHLRWLPISTCRLCSATRFKQAILGETLERGGVHAPDTITVLAAEPWAYRNRIRLAFDAAGNLVTADGVRTRHSYRRMPDCGAAAGEGCTCSRRDFAGVARRLGPARFPSFATRRRPRCW